MDSAVTLAHARAAGHLCHALSLDYGQRHRAELEAAKIEFLRIGEGRDAQVWITDPAGNTIELGQDPDC